MVTSHKFLYLTSCGDFVALVSDVLMYLFIPYVSGACSCDVFIFFSKKNKHSQDSH